MMKRFHPHASEIPLLLDGRMTAIMRPVAAKKALRKGTADQFYDWAEHGPFGPTGTILWCKERWWSDWKDEAETEECYAYEQGYGEIGVEWKPAISMPKAACRLWLEVLEVKVCKLMDLNNEEMYETGVRIDDSYRLGISTGCEGSVEGFNLGEGIRRVFYEIFDDRFGKRKVTNPWIWYASIRRIEKP